MASWAGRGRRRAREERGHSREGMYAYLGRGRRGSRGGHRMPEARFMALAYS